MMVECLEANIFYEQLLFFYLELLSLTSVMVNLYLLLLTVFTLYDFIYGQLLFVAFGCIYIRLYLSYHMYISGAPEQEGHIIESGADNMSWKEIDFFAFRAATGDGDGWDVEEDGLEDGGQADEDNGWDVEDDLEVRLFFILIEFFCGWPFGFIFLFLFLNFNS